MARAMLYMESNEPIEDDDVGDAMGEMVNMLGGIVQRVVRAHGIQTSLGLPIYVDGEVRRGAQMRSTAHAVRVGEHDAVAVVMHGPAED